MKVKIGELKTHLSKYVQSVRDGSEPIEVCVREQTVAYLTRTGEPPQAQSLRENDFAQRLERKGIHLRQRGRVGIRSLAPGEPGDGLEVENSVMAIRAQKIW